MTDSIPNEVPWQDIVHFERLDERVAIANDLCANIIGVNEAVRRANKINWRITPPIWKN